MNSALVSIVTSVASGPSFSRIGRVKVPTPGPYSTNSRVFSQSTGAQHPVDQHPARRDDRADHHRMLQEAAQELPARARRTAVVPALERRRPFTVRAVEIGMEAPWRSAKGASVGKCAAAWQVPATSGALVVSAAKRALSKRRRSGSLAASRLVRRLRGSIARKRGVAATALSTPHFLLLYAAMLVAAAGNTALQSVMPAIGREIGIADFWVAIAYTWSAVLWVLLAPYLGRKERPPRPQGADPDGASAASSSRCCCAAWCWSPGSTAGSAAR